jgi:hypothetical protein
MLDALLWLCVGAQIAFIILMLTMTNVLGADAASVEPAALASDRDQFFKVQVGSLILAIVVGVVDSLVRWRSGRENARG